MQPRRLSKCPAPPGISAPGIISINTCIDKIYLADKKSHPTFVDNKSKIMSNFKKRLRQQTEMLISEGKTLFAISLEAPNTARWLWVPEIEDDCISEVVVMETRADMMREVGQVIAEVYEEIGCTEDMPDLIKRLEKERREWDGSMILNKLFNDN